MAIVNEATDIKSLQVWGKLGKPNQLGDHWLGWTELGDEAEEAGIYQRRKSAVYDGFVKTGRKSRQIIVRMKHYITPNPQTEAQQNWRAVFAAGVSTWNGLTALQKQYYNNLKSPERQSGFTRFMSKYLAQNYPPA